MEDERCDDVIEGKVVDGRLRVMVHDCINKKIAMSKFIEASH